MKVDVEDLRISFDIRELIEAMDLEGRKEVAKICACDDALIQDIVEQLCTGLTDECSSGGDYVLQAMRLKIIERLDEVRFKAMQEVLFEMKAARQRGDEMRDWAWNMYHAWPRETVRCRPSPPDSSMVPMPTEEEVREALK